MNRHGPEAAAQNSTASETRLDPWPHQPRATGTTADWVLRIGQGLVFLKIGLVIFVFDPSAVDSFALAKSAVSHAMTFVIGAALVVILLLRGRQAIVWHPSHVPLLAFVLAAVTSASFAVDRNVALFGISRRYLGLTDLLDGVVLYAAVLHFFRAPRDLGRLLVVTATATVPVLAYLAIEKLDVQLVRYGPSDIGGEAPPSTGIQPISTFGNPDIAGGYFAVCGVALVAAAVLLSAPAAVRFATAALGTACCVGAFATGARNPVLAIGVGGAALGFVALRAATGRRRRVTAISGVVAVLIVSGSLALSPVGARIRPDFLLADPSVQARLEMWQTSVRMTLDRPILGVGPDNFGVVYPSLRAERSVSIIGADVLQNNPHNWALQTLSGTGLIGFVSLLAFIAALLTAAAPRRVHPAAGIALVTFAAYLGQGLVNVTDVGVEWLFWAAAGVLAGSQARQPPRALRFSPPSPGTAALLTSIVVIAALLAAASQRNRLQASESFGTARALVNAGRPLDAVQAARAAITADDARPEYWASLGTSLSAAGNPSAAASAFEQATDRAPWQPVYWRNLGIARLGSGNTIGAVHALRRAVTSDPFDVKSHDLLARLAYNSGDNVMASEEGHIATRLVPNDPALYDAPTSADIQLGRWTDAESLARKRLDLGESVRYRVLLARALFGQGRRSEALVAIDQALALNAEDPEALDLRRQLLQ